MFEGIGRARSYEDGETIFEELSPGKEVFVIESGRVELHRRSMREGQDVDTVIAVLEPGDSVGEMAVFDRGPRSAQAIARGSVKVRVVSRRELLDHMERNPEVALFFLEEMSARIRAMDSLVENLLAREDLAEDLYDEISALRMRRRG